MKRRLVSILAYCAHITPLICCGLITVFLLMSGYESVYNRTLPFIHSIDRVNLSSLASTYNLRMASYTSKSLYGIFGKPLTVKLPGKTAPLTVAPPIKEGSAWLARKDDLHLLLPNAPRSGNIGTTLLYCRTGLQTINDQNMPPVGDNIFMDTDTQWRYVFRITSSRVVPDTTPYVPSDAGDTSKLLIDCDNNAQHVSTVVEASLLSVQGIDQ